MASDNKKKTKKAVKKAGKNNSCECRLKLHMPVFQVLMSPESSGELKYQVLKHCSND